MSYSIIKTLNFRAFCVHNIPGKCVSLIMLEEDEKEGRGGESNCGNI